jgi:nucleoid-associated protein YgaU
VNRTIVIGIVGILVVLIALGLNFWLLGEDEPEAPAVAIGPVAAPPAVAPLPEPAPEPVMTPEPAPEPVMTPEPAQQPAETQAAETAPAPAPVPVQPEPAKVILPEFDVVRVAPTGDIVVAGRAAPGSVVTVYDDGRPIGQIKADGRGEWVMLPDEPLPPGSRELSLSSRLADADPVWSEKVVVIVVPEIGLDIAGQPTDESSGALVVEVPRTGFDTSEVLQQPPAGEAPPLPRSGDIALSVDVLDYDELGNLGLSGRANGDNNVVVYLDNGLLASALAGPDGGWRIIVERPVAPGLYTLRVDEMAGDKVIARLEFPFQRADPKEIESGTLLVVVQPGNSLWRLARRTLGEGTRYTVIYQANRDRIRDPDLIYPGQVFEVPRTN